jgi:hypothetical protein
METLVVYESMFGNTEAVARAVADGIAAHTRVSVLPVGAAPTTIGPEIGLLVVGGPTHAFSMSRANTRASAVEQGATPITPVDRGVREWLAGLTINGHATAVATFDTRVLHTHMPGSAARAALRRLRRHGLTPVAPPASFGVGGTPGPLDAGELERARAWGESLALTQLVAR